MKVDIGFAYLIVEQLDNAGIVPEVAISLLSKSTGEFTQDIVMVRPTIGEKSQSITSDTVDCFVWVDSSKEDYTNKFVIEHYKGHYTEG